MVSLKRTWWLLLLRGLAAIAFGILSLIRPGVSLAALVLLFGAYALVDGVFALSAGFHKTEGDTPWVAQILKGLVGIAAGVITFLWPGITAAALFYVIAAWALVTGAFEIGSAIALRREIDNEWLLALTGVSSILLAVAMIVVPAAGLLAIAWMIGFYALFIGVLLVGLAIRLRPRTMPIH